MGSVRAKSFVKFGILALILVAIDSTPTMAASNRPPFPASSPGSLIDLSHWQLTIPGPITIAPPALSTYSSKYFFYNARTGVGRLAAMAFVVDSRETGTTENSQYVRSELRETLVPNSTRTNWSVRDGTHTLSAMLRLNYGASTPAQVTVLQIHGITPTGGNAPPLLRLAMMSGSLYAWIKRDGSNSDSNTDLLPLMSNIGSQPFSAQVVVQKGQLIIYVNGSTKVIRDVSFWPYDNYFKAGAYPQANSGTSEVDFFSLQVTHAH